MNESPEHFCFPKEALEQDKCVLFNPSIHPIPFVCIQILSSDVRHPPWENILWKYGFEKDTHFGCDDCRGKCSGWMLQFLLRMLLYGKERKAEGAPRQRNGFNQGVVVDFGI